MKNVQFRLFVLMLVASLRPPLSANAQDTAAGARLFHQYCASCHGEKGTGDGPVAPYLKTQPPDLTAVAERREGSFPEEQILRIITGEETPPGHGTRTMPVWGERFQDDIVGGANKSAVARGRVAFLVDYLKTIQGTGRKEFENIVIPGDELRPGGIPMR